MKPLPDDTKPAGSGTPPKSEGQTSSAIADAVAFGVDVDQLRQSLARTPDERLRELDANMTFLAEISPRRGGQPPGESS